MTGKPTAAERTQKGQFLETLYGVDVYYFEGTDRPWGVVQRGVHPWRYATWDAARRTIKKWADTTTILENLNLLREPALPRRARQNNVDLALQP